MTTKAVRWVGWQPPKEGRVEVNTNGVSKDEGIEAVVDLLKIIDEFLQRQRLVSLNSRSTDGSHSQGIAMERGDGKVHKYSIAYLSSFTWPSWFLCRSICYICPL
ncbi:unnamed protein product [Trifolium pratense]|uniref:Uncharacterized protein n=1 Tax=Trifolium pratense TaxID=57577 RepID=A0ACB0M3Q6_TRIPR|nr:unnamed protein product [Trifolium pratense]